MTRVRLRDYPTDEELARLYAMPHDHTRFHDHELRVAQTVQVGLWLGPYSSIADLSCGDAAIPKQIAHDQGPHHASLHLGDYAPRYAYTGPIEQTLNQILDVDLFICSETIEHLRDPDAVLKMIRRKARMLLLSTPIGESHPALDPRGGNPEHVWGWGIEDVDEMLRAAGWTPKVLAPLHLYDYVYDFQIWGCA